MFMLKDVTKMLEMSQKMFVELKGLLGGSSLRPFISGIFRHDHSNELIVSCKQGG